MAAATIIPAMLVVAVKDMAGLADLYAIGVVGAIATNLGASATDKHLGLARWERILMLITFVIMAGIEISLFIDKPNARIFSITVLVIGLILRGLASEWATKKKAATQIIRAPDVSPVTSPAPMLADLREPMLCAVRTPGRTLDFAVDEARETRRPLYVMFVREQAVITPEDRQRKWPQDEDAKAIFDYARTKAGQEAVVFPCYSVSDSAADTIVDVAATLGVSRLILGTPQRGSLLNLLRGNIIRHISGLLPENIQLLICG
jgi:nucleotide-binding universal stress UspA family protein